MRPLARTALPASTDSVRVTRTALLAPIRPFKARSEPLPPNPPSVLSLIQENGSSAMHSAAGSGTLTALVPWDRGPFGQSVFFQAALMDSGAPQGVAFTTGLRTILVLY